MQMKFQDSDAAGQSMIQDEENRCRSGLVDVQKWLKRGHQIPNIMVDILCSPALTSCSLQWHVLNSNKKG